MITGCSINVRQDRMAGLEVGYGMWGMAGWTGSADEESFTSLDRRIARRNFFDTAWAYGDSHSERLLGATLKRHPAAALHRHQDSAEEPPLARAPAHARRGVSFRLHSRVRKEPDQHRRVDTRPATAARLDRRVGRRHALATGPRALKDEGLVRALGISINRWQPENVLRAGHRLIDAVQVVYNVFDQSPEDLFPHAAARHRRHRARAVRRGSLTDMLTPDSTWPQGDFRNAYFHPENLQATVPRVARLRPVVPAGMTMPQLALRHILQHPAVSTVIPGMRKLGHVEQNISVSDGQKLPSALMDELKTHRWDRTVDFE